MNYTIIRQADKLRINQIINNLSDLKKWTVSIYQHREIRSLNQNRLYWLWLACIMDETGSDKDELHKYFGEKYLPREEKKLFGEIKMTPVSTTTLNTKEFKIYLDRIQAEAASELGIILPNPEDYHFREFYDKYKNFI